MTWRAKAAITSLDKEKGTTGLDGRGKDYWPGWKRKRLLAWMEDEGIIGLEEEITGLDGR